MKSRCILGMIAVVGGVAGVANAQPLPYGPTLYRITAVQTLPGGDTRTGFVEFSTLDGNYNTNPETPTGHDGYWSDNNNRYAWAMTIPSIIRGADNVAMGTLNSAYIEIDADPFVTANFNVTAGALNTSFFVSSSPLIVAPDTYTGQASAQVTLTDNNGDGASLSVSTNPAGMYTAMYNGATVFTNLLLGPVNALPFDSAIANASTGVIPIGGVVIDIGAEFNFTLSAEDTATGTSTFTIVPAPGSLALLGLGGLVALRRRR